MIAVMVIQWWVHFLLLLGANMLSGRGASYLRLGLAALPGSAHAMLCWLGIFHHGGWHLLVLALAGVVAFGIKKDTWYPVGLFCILTLAVEGAVSGNGGKGSLIWACALCFTCLLATVCRRQQSLLVPVELRNGDVVVKLTALRDTGNQLHDPISGKPVLVIGTEAACKLTGLTAMQLRTPLQTIQSCPGLRLIPYRSVGCDHGFLLGMYLKNMKIGSGWSSGVVAFAPEGLGMEGKYQALLGGNL